MNIWKLFFDFFENIDTEEKAYFLGLLTADGSVTLDSERSPNISLELVDKDVLEMLDRKSVV